MNRFRDLEKLQAATRAELPRAAVAWLAAARTPLEVLTMAAMDPAITDADFRAMVEEFAAALPGLMEKMDHSAIAGLMENAMGASMANGIAQRVSTTPATRAKLPWESAAWLAGKGKFSESQHPRGKGGLFGHKATHEWPAANKDEAGMLASLTGRKFKEGTRIHAPAEAVHHAHSHHSKNLSAKDWSQLKGRMFEQHTTRSLGRTANNEDAISFKFPRGKNHMEAVFTIHFPHRKSPGELRLKTYAQRG